MLKLAKAFALEGLAERPLVRVVAYYVLLVAGTMLLVQIFPDLGRFFSSERMEDLNQIGPLGKGSAKDLSFLAREPTPISGPAGPAVSVGMAMLGATLLILPVAWVYTMTRQKKGYRQSTVQTLVILPAVVAGVVILVKNSLALAFSLAGIVAAINFRSTLRDTKDAVYIFLGMVIGLAAGVQIMTVALAVSVIFNLLVLILAWTDFGRAPAHLEGARALARLDRAREIAGANRTGMFVSVVEEEILKSLAPEQLDALAQRARKIRSEAIADLDVSSDAKPLDTTVRVYAEDPIGARVEVESVLGAHTKAWKFAGIVRAADGTPALEYSVRLRKKVPGSDLEALLRQRAADGVTRVEVA